MNSSPLLRAGLVAGVFVAATLVAPVLAVAAPTPVQAGGTGKTRPEAAPAPPRVLAANVAPTPSVPVKVIVSQSGKSVSGLTVTFKTSSNNATASTGSGGAAVINLLPGYYTVTTSASGGASASKKIHVNASSTTMIVKLSLPSK